MASSPWLATAVGEDFLVTAPAGIAPLSLPEALAAALSEIFPTSSAAKRACRKKGGRWSTVLSDGSVGRCETKVEAGDLIRVVSTSSKPPPLLEVVHEDDAVAVVRKPAGMVTHADGPGSLTAALARTVPGATPVHRLDAPTEGLVVCARTKEAQPAPWLPCAALLAAPTGTAQPACLTSATAPPSLGRRGT